MRYQSSNRSVLCGLAVLASTLSATWSARATFTGLYTEHVGLLNGREVWRIYAESDNASDVLLNVFNHRVTAGSMNGVQQNDSYGGSWLPTAISNPSQFNDSYVSITGNLNSLGGVGTLLDPSFGTGLGNVIPNNAGWYTSNAAVDIRADSGTYVQGVYRIMLMQVAGATLTPATLAYSATMTIGWKVGGTSSPSFTWDSPYSVPGPGALGALALASAFGRRRRS